MRVLIQYNITVSVIFGEVVYLIISICANLSPLEMVRLPKTCQLMKNKSWVAGPVSVNLPRSLLLENYFFPEAGSSFESFFWKGFFFKPSLTYSIPKAKIKQTIISIFLVLSQCLSNNQPLLKRTTFSQPKAKSHVGAHPSSQDMLLLFILTGYLHRPYQLVFTAA